MLKRSYGEGCWDRTEEMAKKAIMRKAILWNMAVLMVGMEGRGEKVREVIMDGGYDRGEVWRETEWRGAKGGL